MVVPLWHPCDRPVSAGSGNPPWARGRVGGAGRGRALPLAHPGPGSVPCGPGAGRGLPCGIS
ncbi:hypothetical protein GCM10009602_67770 [Nocardiopsis tropica]